MGLSQFDAERSARLKSHIKTKKSVEFFSADFSIFIKLLQNLMKFGLSYSRGFCSALSETAPVVFLIEFFFVVKICRQIGRIPLQCSRIGNGIGIHLRGKRQRFAVIGSANNVSLQIGTVKLDIGITQTR